LENFDVELHTSNTAHDVEKDLHHVANLGVCNGKCYH